MTADAERAHAESPSGTASGTSDAGLGDTLRALGADGRASFDAALATGQALRELLAADLALARGALLHTLIWAGLALVLAGSAWLILMASLVAALQALGLSWLAATATAGGISLVAAVLAALAARRALQHADLHATRRQLAKLVAGARTDSTQSAA